MRKFIYILIIALLSSCSAQWHLNRALKKDSAIIDTEYDSNTVVLDTILDTIQDIQYNTFRVELESDTIIDSIDIDTVIDIEKFEIDKQTRHSEDSIAHAKYWMKDGKLYLNVWSTIDEKFVRIDTINHYRQLITKKTRIIEQKEATIKEQKGFIQNVKDIIKNTIIIIMIIFAIIIIIYLINKFKT